MYIWYLLMERNLLPPPHLNPPWVVLQGEPPLVQPAVAERVVLQGLSIQLGPDLRTTYPVVMNFNISGQVNITGPAQAHKLQLQGIIKLDSGEVTPAAPLPMFLCYVTPQRFT